MKPDKKTILITGASGGIGRAVAQRFSAQGANLILLGRNKDRLIRLQKSLPNPCQIIASDLLSDSDRNRVTEQLRSEYQTVDILINNAGVSDFKLFAAFTDQQISDMIQTNLVAPMQLTRALLPLMNPDAAQIVNMGSTFGSIGYPGFTTYCASKYGLRGFSEALSRELSDTNTIVQYIAPRATKTSINSNAVVKLNKLLGNQMDSPDSVAASIVKAVEREHKSLTLGWPEKLYVRINSICASLISRSINSQLPKIKQFAQEI